MFPAVRLQYAYIHTSKKKFQLILCLFMLKLSLPIFSVTQYDWIKKHELTVQNNIYTFINSLICLGLPADSIPLKNAR